MKTAYHFINFTSWTDTGPARLILLCVLFIGNGYSHLSGQTYIDVASEQNISAVPNSLQYGSGMSFYDFNKDGWDDLSFTLVDDSLVFYKNNGGEFELLPSFLDGPGQTKHLVWVDYDNDGDLDLAVTTFEGQYKLFQNDGNFNFTNVSAAAGLQQASERYYGISFADYDRDGDLDFYVTCYEQLGNESNFSRLNHLYRNEGDGTFTNVTLEAGVGDGIRLSFKGVWFDYDKDGWPDLFVINDRVNNNSLYHNNGDGTFTDVSVEAGIQLGGQDPMTATVGDFDNDGDLDVFMSNTNAPLKRGQLLVNNNDGTFTESASDYGVDIFGWTWGAVWVDYDNDTHQDLFVCQGHPTFLNQSPNFFLHNQNSVFFTDATDLTLISQDSVKSYSVARGDFNNDGFYDIGVLNRAPNNVNLYKNSGNDNNFIKFTLTGSVSNSMAIGSWIRVFVNGMQYTQYTMCGENYLAQNSQHHIFGLGEATTADSVEVEYVLGHTDTYYNLPANEHYYLTEGETYIPTLAADGKTTFCAGDSIVLDAGDHAYYTWNTGHTDRYLTSYSSGQYWATVQNEFGIIKNTDTIQTVTVSNPAIVPTVTHVSCFGMNDGAIELEAVNGTAEHLVEWDNFMEGAQIDSLPPGTYNYIYTDTNLCQATGSIFIQQPLALSMLLFPFPEVEGDDGSVSLILNGGTTPYTIYLNGIETEGTVISGLSAGDYIVLIVDANGCQVQQKFMIDNTTSIQGLPESQNVLFPNPVVNGQSFQLSLKDAHSLKSITIFDASGKKIHMLTGFSGGNFQTLNLPDLKSGWYYLLLRYANDEEDKLPLLIVDRE